MKYRQFLSSFTLCFMAASITMSAATLTYQPSPYRGKDIQVSPTYTSLSLDTSELKVGGNGDIYASAIQFDLEGLPSNPTFVGLYMWAYSPGGGATPISMTAYALTNDWAEGSSWGSASWSGYNLGTILAPTYGQFNGIGFTSLYGQWKSGAIANKGFLFMPTSVSNKINPFYSSDVSSPYYRPFLYIEYTPAVTPPNFKLPLPGNRSWVVTTEIGSYDQKNPSQVLDSHIDGNYFSIDFGPSSIPAYSGDIPIYAAAAGKVVVAGYNQFNGNHVVIDHDYDGNQSTGYTTRYLHFKYSPAVSVNQNVNQGDLLGYMGDTGEVIGVDGTHLHFGIRYNGSGSSSVDELSYVKMEGICLKQYQTSYVNGARTSDSYYPSTNTP